MGSGAPSTLRRWTGRGFANRDRNSYDEDDLIHKQAIRAPGAMRLLDARSPSYQIMTLATIPQIVLASTSPRRRELLGQIGVRFEAIASGESEEVDPSLSAIEAVQFLANRKASAVARMHPSAFVIGGDTVISFEGSIIGKPENSNQAKELLRRLSGRTHQVVSGVALIWESAGITDVFHVATDVTFGRLTDDIIERYVATGEPLDKAGAYAIQGAGAILVESVKGSYYNIVGLPLYEVALGLRRHLGDSVCLIPEATT